MDIHTGIVKTVTDKGFGFIAKDGAAETDKDLFFHASALIEAYFNDLREGDRVSFEIEETDRGTNAINVTLLGDDAPAAAPVADEADDSDVAEEAPAAE